MTKVFVPFDVANLVRFEFPGAVVVKQPRVFVVSELATDDCVQRYFLGHHEHTEEAVSGTRQPPAARIIRINGVKRRGCSPDEACILLFCAGPFHVLLDLKTRFTYIMTWKRL